MDEGCNKVVIIGGGAAGYFAAITAAEKTPMPRLYCLKRVTGFYVRSKYREVADVISPTIVMNQRT